MTLENCYWISTALEFHYFPKGLRDGSLSWIVHKWIQFGSAFKAIYLIFCKFLIGKHYNRDLHFCFIITLSQNRILCVFLFLGGTYFTFLFLKYLCFILLWEVLSPSLRTAFSVVHFVTYLLSSCFKICYILRIFALRIIVPSLWK